MITRPKGIEKSVTGIICHPHPLHGGTMNNKVLTTLAKALDELGLKTVRFNFRGVGKSQGRYDNGVGEVEDLKAVLRWVEHHWSQDDIWLAGFSFGAYISAKVAYDQKVAQLISVVTTLAKALDELGLKTVRFNFRGVGKSQGRYDNGVGEVEDLKAVLRWVEHHWSQDDIWLAGFSFGAYISAKVAYDQKVAQLISVAPPVFYEGFASLTQMASPWLIVQGDQDEVVPFEQVKAFVNQISSPVEFVVMSGASHFFHGRLIELRELLVRNLA
nr:alpha/beta fold hydrolase [Coxiella burnetii]